MHNDHICDLVSSHNEDLGYVLLALYFGDAFILTHEKSMPNDGITIYGSLFYLMPHRLWFHEYDASCIDTFKIKNRLYT